MLGGGQGVLWSERERDGRAWKFTDDNMRCRNEERFSSTLQSIIISMGDDLGGFLSRRVSE